MHNFFKVFIWDVIFILLLYIIVSKWQNQVYEIKNFKIKRVIQLFKTIFEGFIYELRATRAFLFLEKIDSKVVSSSSSIGAGAVVARVFSWLAAFTFFAISSNFFLLNLANILSTKKEKKQLQFMKKNRAR